MFLSVCAWVLTASMSSYVVAGESQAADAWAQYQNLAKQTYQTAKTAPLSQLEQQGVQLVSLAEQMLPQFIKAKPQCKVYLDAALRAKDDMLVADLARMERDYHSDGKLPKLTDGTCYHAKDLLVHAATVVVLAKETLSEDKKREQIAHEVEEVLEHFEVVKALSK